MNQINVAPDETEKTVPVEKQTTSKARQSKRLLIAAIALAIVAVAIIVWYFSRSGDNRAGKPVPAPRASSFEETEATSEFAAGQTITLQPEQLKNADVKIETVGEQINATETAALATGVIQANDYRETPVISLVGGVVRQINVQAGENVQAGQAIAVVFSNEFAEAQARYLDLRAQLDEARKIYARNDRLVTINQSGRSEFEGATAQLKSAEAEQEEFRKRFERTQKLLQIGAASREELEQDTTKLRAAEARAAEARLRLERSKQLLEINPVARAEFDAATTKLRAAEAELSSARQRLLQLGMSGARVDALRSANQISGEIAVPAPASGTVTSRAANAGEVVEANKELARITNLSSVWAVAQVFEKDVTRLRVGSGASVVTDAFPDEVFRGTVTYIDPRLDEATRTAQARVELANPGNRLKIGMYVRIAFGALGDGERTAPAIPSSAVQTVNNRQIVFVATAEPNVFELRPVRLGAESGGQRPVLEGLTVGERVVTGGSFLLRAEWVKTNQGTSGR